MPTRDGDCRNSRREISGQSLRQSQAARRRVFKLFSDENVWLVIGDGEMWKLIPVGGGFINSLSIQAHKYLSSKYLSGLFI